MKKKYLLFLSTFALVPTILFGQTQLNPNSPLNSPFKSSNAVRIETVNLHQHEHGSGFGEHSCKTQELTEKYYESTGQIEEFNHSYETSTENNPTIPQNRATGANNIAIIFHVVYNPDNPAENVSYADIMNVYNDISEDFQLLNSDAANARSAYGFTPADADIDFCLATQSPDGTPLTEPGVIRVSTTEDWYDSDNGEENKMKSSSTGGSDIWDRNDYLNVWICDISNGASYGTAGYAYRPTTTLLPSSSIDGIVIDYNLGVNNENVLTHEIGHYLGLDHTWGGSGGCTNDDGFTDTPDTDGPSYNYSGTCSGNQTTCSGIQTQYENYMDYSNCTVMFTQEQVNYMSSILNGIRSSLALSTGCDPVNAPPVVDFDADISSPIIIPVGGSVVFNDLSTNSPTSWSWDFGGGAASQTVENPSVTFNTVGTYTVTLTATNSYGSGTETKTDYVQVVAAASGSACDTLRNYDPSTEGYAYYSTGTGYLPGTGTLYGDNVTKYAEPFTATSSTEVRRLRFPIAIADNQSGTGLVKIRVQEDNLGEPGNVLVTDTLLIDDMNAGYFNEFDFTNPATVTGNFWVTFELEYGAPQDTVLFYMVDYNDRASSMINTMNFEINGAWYETQDIFSVYSSMWLDVLTSNGSDPVASLTYSESEICVGGDIVVNGSASTNVTNYYWYVTDDPYTTILDQSNTAGNTFTFNTVGDNLIYLFADGACKTDGLYLPITVNAAPTATITTTNTTCGENNGGFSFSGASNGTSSGYTYSIDGTNYQASTAFSNLAPGNYTVHVKTDGDNCDTEYTETIANSSELSATISDNTMICPGETATLTATGGTTYTWYDGTTVVGTTASIDVQPSTTTQYSCEVTDGTCSATLFTTVTTECLGITDQNQNVKLYPNPTNKEIFIEIQGEFEYVISDASGRIIGNGFEQNNSSFDLSTFQNGVYFISIQSDSVQRTFKVIKK